MIVQMLDCWWGLTGPLKRRDAFPQRERGEEQLSRGGRAAGGFKRQRTADLRHAREDALGPEGGQLGGRQRLGEGQVGEVHAQGAEAGVVGVGAEGGEQDAVQGHVEQQLGVVVDELHEQQQAQVVQAEVKGVAEEGGETT